MEQSLFRGCFTAMVTPFKPNGDLDEAALLRLIDFQLAQDITGLVPCGTTGESVTLNEDEYRRVLELTIGHVNGRVPVICGAGGNDTRKTIKMAKLAQSLGADGLLTVTPYYNKPTQTGLYEHYRAVAEAVDTPILLYNVPGRTSVNLIADTTLRLAELPNIVGIKEASSDLVQAMQIIKNRPEGFTVLSGDDVLTMAILNAGGDGVISVISNEVPAQFTRMVYAALEDDYTTARAIHYKLMQLMQVNFIETNPVPVKAALAMMGIIGHTVRQPLAQLSASSLEQLRTALGQLELLKEETPSLVY